MTSVDPATAFGVAVMVSLPVAAAPVATVPSHHRHRRLNGLHGPNVRNDPATTHQPGSILAPHSGHTPETLRVRL